MTPTALYVHIPFCLKRCNYCDFNSTVYQERLASRYIKALARELEGLKGYPFRTVYIGGGTPTALMEGELETLLKIIGSALDKGIVKEYTVEANPGTLNSRKVFLLKGGGVNRMSLGVQSFQERGLRLLGRIHSRQDAITAFHLLRRGGLDNISIDLIFGWPGQGPEDWEGDLREAIALGPEHISTYCLTIERGTPLASLIRTGEQKMPEETLQLEMFKKAISTLTQEGFRHYEISNFARKGRECLHNINYWRNVPYIGIGAGAFSYLAGSRMANVKDVHSYIERIEQGKGVKTFRETLSPRGRAAETLVMSLRMTSGIRDDTFSRSTGFSLKELYGREIEKSCIQGLLSLKKGRLRLTRRGLFVADSVMVEFI